MHLDTTYENLLNNFFEHSVLSSTYKGALLYALTDIGLYGNEDLVGQQWIQYDGNEVKMELDFVAIRFAKYYWEIIDSGIKHTSVGMTHPSQDVNIIHTIREKIGTAVNYVPEIAELAEPEMKDFRKKVIQKSIKSEVLKHLLNDMEGLYTKKPRQNYITFDIRLIDFMKNNSKEIKKRIGTLMEKHLKKYNPDIVPAKSCITMNNPFYIYVRNQNPSLFLVCVEHANLVENYEQTVRKKIHPKDHGMTQLGGKPVGIWGLRDTKENRSVWKDIGEKDIILFSRDNQCFSRGRVVGILHNAEVAKSVWTEEHGRARDLLIIMDEIRHFVLDLKSSGTLLVDPTMPSEYNFPIVRISDQRVDHLVVAFGSIATALDNITESSVEYGRIVDKIPSDVRVELDRHEGVIRRKQREFRNMVLDNYNNKCAVCKLEENSFLEAAHIIPVANLETSGSVDNGICFCVLHHAMFDRGNLFFNDNYEVVLSEKAQSYKQLEKSCELPSKITGCKVLPSKNYLEKHRLRFGFDVY